MNRRILRVDGTEEAITKPLHINALAKLIGTEILDSVNLRKGMVMLVDDLGYKKNLPVNNAATFLYHSISRPGVEWKILGDVVIVPDSDFMIATSHG